MSRPRAHSTILSAVCLAALLHAGCGGGGPDYASVERLMRSGQLDKADAALAGVESDRAAALRERIAARRAASVALEAELAELEALDPKVAVKRLSERAERERDAVAKDRIERALSRAVDRRASGVASREHETASYVPTYPDVPAGGSGASTAPERRDVGRDASLLDGVVASVNDQLVRAEWARAVAEVEMALDRAGDRVAELRALRDLARRDAEAEARELAGEARQLSEGDAAVRDVVERQRDRLASELRRFPSGAGLEVVREALDVLDARAGELRAVELARVQEARSPAVEAPAPEPEGDAALAQSAEAEDDLERAIDLWLEAAFDHPPGAQRDAAVGHARGLERRLSVRKEVVAAFAREPAPFAALEVGDVELTSMTVGGERTAWSALPIDLMLRLARLSELSREAELGLLAERVARGDIGGSSGALAEAHRLVERGTIDEEQAWSVVALARGEAVPERGYSFASGRWTPRAEAELAAALEELTRLEKKLVKAKPAQREALLDQLAEMGEVSDPAIERALTARFEAAVRDLSKGNTLDQLAKVAEQRRQLDDKRAFALELIFDEEEYFYPYRPPEVPAEKAKLYWPVQQRVDGLVAAVREIWDAPREAKLPGSFRDALEEIAWLQAEGASLELAFELPDELPTWVAALDPSASSAGLREFALNVDEAESFAYDRAVRARNERLWLDQDGLSEEQRASGAEQRQVRLTNDYRVMFGRRAVAWNPLIEEAARMHSEYMANTGDFGHYEPDPERKTPGDRMRLAGYTFGVSENCAMNGGDPEGAHYGWTHSSGHHRNLLNPGHREMASAVASRYWTQNFGVDRGFVAELDSWQD